jgi:hypothetical protein
MKQTKKCGFCTKTVDEENNKRDEKKYCDDICRNKYHSYKRSYAEILINSGQLDFQTVKKQIEKNLYN